MRVTLPRVHPSLTRCDHPASVAPRADPSTILVVEDREGVRTLIAEALELAGHTVLTALDGETGVQIAEVFDGPIDLVVCDVVLPGTQGPETVQRIQETRPDTKALYISGYDRNGLDAIDGDLLQKPFTTEQLEDRIAEILTGPGRV